MIYIFLYNVVYIKSDISKLKYLLDDDSKFILIGSNYCLERLNQSNYQCFNKIHHIYRDFHEVNYHEIEQIVMEYINKYGAKNIRLLTNEDSTQLVCARLRETYGIIGSNKQMVLPFVDKVVSKQVLQPTIKIPMFIKFDKNKYKENKEEYLKLVVSSIGKFPMFGKPIDLVSSIETHFIPDMKALNNFADLALLHDYEFEIDEFINGDLFHCDTIIIGGKIKFFMVGRCSFPLVRFFDGKPVGSIPIQDQTLFNRLKLFNNNVCKRLKCSDGVYHLEVFLQSETNEIVFLEIASRTGGASITNVYEKVFGINIEEINYKIQMGLIHEILFIQKNIYAGFLNFPTVQGVVKKINNPSIDIDYEFINYVKPNDCMRQAKNLLDIACCIIFWDEDYDKVENCFDKLKNYQPLHI